MIQKIGSGLLLCLWGMYPRLYLSTYPKRIPSGCCHMAGSKHECDIWKHEMAITLYRVQFRWNEVFTEKCYIDMVQVYVYATVRLYHSNQLDFYVKGDYLHVVGMWNVTLLPSTSVVQLILDNIIRKAKSIECKVFHISSALNEKLFKIRQVYVHLYSKQRQKNTIHIFIPGNVCIILICCPGSACISHLLTLHLERKLLQCRGQRHSFPNFQPPKIPK